MTLTQQQINEVASAFMQHKSEKLTPLDLNSDEVIIAVAGMDQWLEALKDALTNSSTPTANQKLVYQDKLWLIIHVMQKRLDTQY